MDAALEQAPAKSDRKSPPPFSGGIGTIATRPPQRGASALVVVLLCCSVLPAAAMSGQDAARDRMLSELKGGALGAEPSASAEGDASSKRVLIRGCDPVMAERAKGFLPALIGNAQIERWVAIAPAKAPREA